MTKQELRAWLCGDDDASFPTLGDAATVLDGPVAVGGVAATRFTVAVLRDVFPDDGLVRRWLRTPRVEFGGRSGLDLLRAGRAGAVERLALREWHAA